MKGDHFSVIYIHTAIRRKYDKTKVEKTLHINTIIIFPGPSFVILTCLRLALCIGNTRLTILLPECIFLLYDGL